MNYYELQQSVFDHLLQKHQQDTSFTFSVRKKFSSGKEQNYFIGTEASGYFAFTLWDVPVSYPGASIDMLCFIINPYEDGTCELYFQYYTTRNYNDRQNQANFLLGEQLREDLAGSNMVWKANDESKKMSWLAVYWDGLIRHEDLLQSLDIFIPRVSAVVNHSIKAVLRRNPDWRAGNISKISFDQMIARLKAKQSPSAQSSLPTTAFDPTEERGSLLLSADVRHPLNAILYGPPGTGKTYHSINRALQIIEGLTEQELAAKYPYREDLKEQFDFYVTKGQIAFCTFHQSFSYEDFVEGIKPTKPKEGDLFLKYDVRDGIFKELAEEAEAYADFSLPTPPEVTAAKPIADGVNFYKMSLGNTQDLEDEVIYRYCIQNNCIALGYGDEIDFGPAQDRTEISRLIKENSDSSRYAITAVTTFRIGMQKGDVVVISKGNYQVRAIARITGEYKFAEVEEIRYCHFRSVEWLVKDVDIPAKELFERNLSMQTIYYLDRHSIKLDYFQSLLSPRPAPLVPKVRRKRNFVLIIDEINRGNVSQIFGELITLLEESKRKGCPEALSVQLPYSQKTFSVPANLYLIGTMNTADRSVEALDTALRRRFSFVGMAPNPQLVSPAALVARLWQAHESVGWEEEPYRNKANKLYSLLKPSFANDIVAQQRIFDAIPDDYNFTQTVAAFAGAIFTGLDPEKLLSTINRRIEKLIDKDHCIGHSYLLSLVDCQEPLQELRNIFANRIVPLLQEYFFGDLGKMELVIGEDFFEPAAGAVNVNADHFFAKSSYEGKEDLMSRPVYKLRSLTKERMPDDHFLKAVKHIYTHG